MRQGIAAAVLLGALLSGSTAQAKGPGPTHVTARLAAMTIRVNAHGIGEWWTTYPASLPPPNEIAAIKTSSGVGGVASMSGRRVLFAVFSAKPNSRVEITCELVWWH